MTLLVDLDPTWILRGGRVVGVRFVCPINDGSGPHMEGHSICVLFSNPPDGGPAHLNDEQAPGNNGGNRWNRTGTSFDGLGLSPSVDCTQTDAHCWHGFVTNGQVT